MAVVAHWGDDNSRTKIGPWSPECLSFSELLVGGLLEEPEAPPHLKDCERCRSLSEKLVEEWIRLDWISHAEWILGQE